MWSSSYTESRSRRGNGGGLFSRRGNGGGGLFSRRSESGGLLSRRGDGGGGWLARRGDGGATETMRSYGERIAAPMREVSDTELGRGLGWASIGIGLTELLAPQQVENMLGLKDMPERRGTIRVLGVRELCHGIGILTEREANRKMKVGVWSRVAGDVLDSALLGIAAMKTNKPVAFAAVSAAVLGIGLADLICATRLSERA
jgi:hypothetical protein